MQKMRNLAKILQKFTGFAESFVLLNKIDVLSLLSRKTSIHTVSVWKSR